MDILKKHFLPPEINKRNKSLTRSRRLLRRRSDRCCYPRLSSTSWNVGEIVAKVPVGIEKGGVRTISSEPEASGATEISAAAVLLWIRIIAVGHEHAVEYH